MTSWFKSICYITAQMVVVVSITCLAVRSAQCESNAQSEFATVGAGNFQQGSNDGEWDERPVRRVDMPRGVVIATQPVTNREFEAFQPKHRDLRKSAPAFAGDDAPAVMVSWQDAMDYCEWLSNQRGTTFRLPTEAEWEYACRQRPDLFEVKAPEEWCLDWYGPYTGSSVSDPAGPKDGEARVVRGGGYRSKEGRPSATNRLSNLPLDRNRLVGFRLVQGELPEAAENKSPVVRTWARDVNQKPFDWAPTVNMSKPFFAEPIYYVRIPESLQGGPLYIEHNHDPGITYCPNGDLFAIWYSTKKEAGRELAVAASRLRRGANEWDEADVFWDVADRNDHAPALWTDSQGKLFHFNGLDVDEGWDELAIVMRTSADNGQTWSTPVIINEAHEFRNQPIASVFGDDQGHIYLPCDAVPGGAGGTALHVSSDGGKTWKEYGKGQPVPKFEEGGRGAWIAGIHAGVTQNDDGEILALGRGNDIGGQMPKSISRDGGKTWQYSASEFPPIGGGQRVVLKKLREGPLLLISFTKGSVFTDSDGKEFNGRGMFAALSEDGGKTWPVRKLLTDGKKRKLDGNAWTDEFVMDGTHAEPKGYLAAAQTPDGVIHLISSGVHYRFNLAWLHERAKR